MVSAGVEKSANMDSNGVDGISDGTGGRAACEGAFLLHVTLVTLP